jgi:hypothetical protein
VKVLVGVRRSDENPKNYKPTVCWIWTFLSYCLSTFMQGVEPLPFPPYIQLNYFNSTFATWNDY